MNARELHDEIAVKAGGVFVVSHPEHTKAILSALSLAAAVEGSQDEIVRELRCLSADAVPGSGTEKIADKAASALVAMKAAKEKAEGEVERLLLDSEAEHAHITALGDDRRKWEQHYHDERALHGLTLERVEAIKARAEKAEAERDVLKQVYEHAYGMTLGVDWNHGTHAKHHREPLIAAIAAYRAAKGTP